MMEFLLAKVRLNKAKSFKIIVPKDQIRGTLIEILVYNIYEYFNNFRLGQLQNITLVDAGAHVGIYTIRAAHYVQKVIAIEPCPFNYTLLKKNIQLNKLPNILLIDAALWFKESETVELQISSDSASHKLSTVSKIVYLPNSDKIPVKTISLKDVLKLASSKIDLLKMDIEGAELDVLSKAEPGTLKAIDKLVVELHPDVYGTFGIAKILNNLRRNSFSVAVIDPLYEFRNREVIKFSLSSSLEGCYAIRIWAVLSHFVRKLLRKRGSQILYAWK